MNFSVESKKIFAWAFELKVRIFNLKRKQEKQSKFSLKSVYAVKVL